MNLKHFFVTACALLLAYGSSALAAPQEVTWLADLERAVQLADSTGRPLLAAFR